MDAPCSDIVFRAAVSGDIPEILEIIRASQSILAGEGIDQWQHGYPEESDISADISADNGCCLTRGGHIIAYAAAVFTPEPTYEHIYGGCWDSDEPYVTVHRIAVLPALRGHGIGTELLSHIRTLALSRDIFSIRVDTHRDNLHMRDLLARNGFSLRGTILLADGSPRCAYEKSVKPGTV